MKVHYKASTLWANLGWQKHETQPLKMNNKINSIFEKGCALTGAGGIAPGLSFERRAVDPDVGRTGLRLGSGLADSAGF